MHLDLVDWRRRNADLYRRVRDAPSPEEGHALWRAGRDALFRDHPQTPLAPDDPLRDAGLPCWPYDPALRWTLPLLDTGQADGGPGDAGPGDAAIVMQSSDGPIPLRRIATVELPLERPVRLDVWWLDQYGGGIWLPLRDGTAGAADGSYGGGRYLLDTVKGADLGGADGRIVVDLNFLYHPSCRYSPRWACPLAPEGNRIAAPVRAGERMS